jgi:hypothetical protein
MDEYFTLESMGTFAGMVVVLTVIVQFLKPLIDKIVCMPTRYVVWIIAIIISAVYQAIAGPFTWAAIFLLILNSIVLTMAAMGTYEVTFKKIETK